VHFLRFELEPAVVRDLHAGAELDVGVDHPAYQHHLRVPAAALSALVADLD
jgi:hypothetical protein